MVATQKGRKNLRKANKVRRQVEREDRNWRTQEREANILKNLPPDRNQESARKEVAHRMHQHAQFQQIKESVRGLRSGGVSQITTPDPYQGYPDDPAKVRKWRDEHDTQRIEEVLLERNKEHL